MNEYIRAHNTMGESGIEWIDLVFRFCVIFLVEVSKLLGVSYEELNIWLFVIILPLILIISFTLNIYFWIRLMNK